MTAHVYQAEDVTVWHGDCLDVLALILARVNRPMTYVLDLFGDFDA